MNKLSEIQQKLKVPKSEYNSFGKYKYRTAEGILEAVKPLLGDCLLMLSDDIVESGGRVYVRATAILHTDKEVYDCTAYAREPEAQKGMNESQITGSASSYARKYALQGLFLLDDGQDQDNHTTEPPSEKKVVKEKVAGEAWKKVISYYNQRGNLPDDLQKIKDKYILTEKQLKDLG